MTTALLTGTEIDCRRMPGGWTATVEQLKPGKWEVRVYDPLGEVGFIDSTLTTREIAFAVAHREAWAEYAEGLAYVPTPALVSAAKRYKARRQNA